MSTNAKIKEQIQKLEVGDVVELYDLNATSLGATTYYFTPMTTDSGTSVYFDSIEYIPLPVKLEGVEQKGDGKLPRPLLTVSNVSLTFSALISTYNDGLGAVLTRRRTLRQYLDDGDEPDSSQFPLDVYILERKTLQNKFEIIWELASIIDNESLLIPKRQCIAENCGHRYRIWDGEAFDYDNATCPYTGANYWDATGEVTTSELDDCGKHLYDCRLRFENATKPFRGFPGVGKLGYPYR